MPRYKVGDIAVTEDGRRYLITKVKYSSYKHIHYYVREHTINNSEQECDFKTMEYNTKLDADHKFKQDLEGLLDA